MRRRHGGARVREPTRPCTGGGQPGHRLGPSGDCRCARGAHAADATAHLIALMDDALMGESLLSDGESPDDWREALAAIARQTREVFLRHPWAPHSLQGGGRRPGAPIGPNGIRHFEQSLAALAHPSISAERSTSLQSSTTTSSDMPCEQASCDCDAMWTPRRSQRSSSSVWSRCDPPATRTSRSRRATRPQPLSRTRADSRNDSSGPASAAQRRQGTRRRRVVYPLTGPPEQPLAPSPIR
jgi:tetracycline repressor-like protein